VLPLAEKAGVTVDALNAELLRIDGIITTIENATKNVQKTSGSISEIVNSPVEAVTDLAGKVRTAFREKRAEVRDAARRHERAEADADYFVDDDACDDEVDDDSAYDENDDVVGDDGILAEHDDEGFVPLEESDVATYYHQSAVYDDEEDLDEDEDVTDEDL
jgi:hypothetical protein